VTSAVDDTIVVTNHLRDRFGQDQIYLLGQSWGTVLGVRAIQEHPELYRAYIGTGQMVDIAATDRIMYDDTLAWARDNDDAALVASLEAIGPPPYDAVQNYEVGVGFEHDVYPYDHTGNSEGDGQYGENPIVAEYSLLDKLHYMGGFLDTYSVLYPQLQDIDFRADATRFDIPVFFVQGAHEADSRALLFDEWFPTVDAPIKDGTELQTSGHRPLWEQPDQFVDYMVDVVLTQAPPAT
jgi:proline iminopeptidase